MAQLEYRRLTRAKNRALFGIVSTSRSSLWLGPDHLLQIDTNGYTEGYKRFYFRDIQALVLCRTDDWLYQALVLAGLAVFFGLLAVMGRGGVGSWVFGIIAGLFAVFVLLHLAAGPTVKAYLRTAVQTERLVSAHRLRRARHLFDTLRPLIIAAQGELKTDRPIPPVISPGAAPVSATLGGNSPAGSPDAA